MKYTKLALLIAIVLTPCLASGFGKMYEDVKAYQKGTAKLRARFRKKGLPGGNKRVETRRQARQTEGRINEITEEMNKGNVAQKLRELIDLLVTIKINPTTDDNYAKAINTAYYLMIETPFSTDSYTAMQGVLTIANDQGIMQSLKMGRGQSILRDVYAVMLPTLELPKGEGQRETKELVAIFDGVNWKKKNILTGMSRITHKKAQRYFAQAVHGQLMNTTMTNKIADEAAKAIIAVDEMGDDPASKRLLKEVLQKHHVLLLSNLTGVFEGRLERGIQNLLAKYQIQRTQ